MLFGLFGGQNHWEASEIPDLTGKVAIVTGGNTGLGFSTVLELARHGAKVYMASRTESRALTAIEDIKKQVPTAAVEYLPFDLQKLASGKQAAERFVSLEQRLDILVNNAGIMAVPYEINSDGIEVQACNATGHAALTIPLLPILKETAARPDSHVRIVNLTSKGHMMSSPDFSSLEGLNKKCTTSMHRYGNSKLANILLTNELQKRLEGTGVYCLSVHPGLVDTGITLGFANGRPYLAPFMAIYKHALLITPQEGALTQLYAATSPEVEKRNLKGAYLEPYGKVVTPSALAQDKDGKLGAQFWSLCEKLIAEKS